MLRKHVFAAAVIGGVVGAVLVMAVGLIAPLEAQNEAKDVEFGKITCTELTVVFPNGEPAATILPAGHGGLIWVTSKGNKDKPVRSAVHIGVDENGGIVYVFSNMKGEGAGGAGGVGVTIGEYGGNVAVFGRGDAYTRASMGVNESGNGAVSTWDKNGYRLANLK
ncbi:MAG: hypothetical protein OXN17_05640 [Candidatus Poribacteria bacterium]|nr:hypothetical protein [Candidatus Poribacteria bacterium]MDE0505306.1 hypothetical protein [Candidatus Poribacteria bacterium]